MGAFVTVSWQKILWIFGIVGHPPLSSIGLAIDTQLLGIGLAVTAYFLVVKRRLDRAKLSPMPISDGVSFSLCLFLAMPAIPGFVSSSFFVPYLSMLWVGVALRATSQGRWHWCADLMLLTQTVFFFITSQTLFYGFSCFIISMFAAFYFPSKKAFFRMAVLFVLVFLLQMYKSDYRKWTQEKPKPAKMTSLELFPTPTGWQCLQYFQLKTEYNPLIPRSMAILLGPVRLFNLSFYYKPAYPNLVVRFFMEFVRGLLRLGEDSLERVLFYTPRFVPFWGGETYRPLLYVLVPRALWPEKPATVHWNTFGARYLYFEGVDDPRTSVTFNYLSEGYMNFGYRGLAVVALLFGGLLGVLENWVQRVPNRFRVWFTVVLSHWAFFPLEAYSLVSALVHTLGVLGLVLLVEYFVAGLARLNKSDSRGFGFFEANPFL